MNEKPCKSTLTQVNEGQKQFTCANCKVTFWRYPNGNRGKYCSRACTNACHIGKPPKLRTDPMECSKCKESKPLADYPVFGGTTQLRCRECIQPTPERKRRWHLRDKFNMSLEEWVALYNKQQGRCPTCLDKLPSLDQLTEPLPRIEGGNKWSGARNWNTDHCHKTGVVRGITCRTCNQGLGSFKDNPETLVRAAIYLLQQLQPTEIDSAKQKLIQLLQPDATSQLLAETMVSGVTLPDW